jgi:hypothetical protein
LALNECGDCTTPFAVGLPRCPHCRSTNFAEQGQDMPKITEHGGATNAAEPGPDLTASTGAVIATSGAWEGEDGPELADLPYGDTVYPADSDETEAETEADTEEESSPGSSSSPSSETPPTEPETKPAARRSRAPKTVSRSKKAPTDDSSVDSTAGDQTEATSAADATTTD